MRKYLFILLLLASAASFGQSKNYIRGDSTIIMKNGGNAELQVLNATRAVANGIATNVGNGVMRYVAPSFIDSLKRVEDSVFAKINGIWHYYFIDSAGGNLPSLGTAFQLLRVNSGATALEYFTPSYLTGSGTTLQYFRGDGTLATFLTDVRAGISLTTTGSSGAATYNSGTGVLNIPEYESGVSRLIESHGVIIGNSTIAAYDCGTSGIEVYLMTTADSAAGSTITNIAVPGHTIAQQQAVWEADSDKATYDWVLVEIGLNDLNPAESAATALGRYQELIDTINAQKKSSAVVIVSAMIPCKQRLTDLYGGSGPAAYQKWIDMNNAIMGGEPNKITGVDYRINKHVTLLNDGSGNLSPAYDCGDHIHQNNVGRQIIASVWREELNYLELLNTTIPLAHNGLVLPSTQTWGGNKTLYGTFESRSTNGDVSIISKSTAATAQAYTGADVTGAGVAYLTMYGASFANADLAGKAQLIGTGVGLDIANYSSTGDITFSTTTGLAIVARIANNGNVNIGTDATPDGKFTVGSASQFMVSSAGDLTRINNVGYTWPSDDGTVGQVLTTDGSGNLSWEDATSGVTASSTTTFTNKRWTARVGSTTSSGTPTINTDNYDIYKLTAQAANITSMTTNLSGTPVDGDVWEVQITADATYTLAWGASFVSTTVALPTAITTTTLTVILQYYSTSSYGNNKWHCVNYY